MLLNYIFYKICYGKLILFLAVFNAFINFGK